MRSIICAAANVTAQAIWLSANPSLSASDMPAALAVNCSIVDELLTCLLDNVYCPTIQSYLRRRLQAPAQAQAACGGAHFTRAASGVGRASAHTPVANGQPPQETHYAGVFGFGTYSLYPAFYFNLLGDYLSRGTVGTCNSDNDCAASVRTVDRAGPTTRWSARLTLGQVDDAAATCAAVGRALSVPVHCPEVHQHYGQLPRRLRNGPCVRLHDAGVLRRRRQQAERAGEGRRRPAPVASAR